jgi:tRNA G18 (ribose-2'-O)-methylase SpoU
VGGPCNVAFAWVDASPSSYSGSNSGPLRLLPARAISPRYAARVEAVRSQLAGPDEIGAALDARAPVRLLLASACPSDARAAAVVERARAAGIAVHAASEASLRRLSKTDPPAEVLALVGPDPGASAEEALAAGGAAWLLVGVAYPGNTGFAIRTAEVSGADCVFVENDFDHEARREATRAAMRADRYLPVFWRSAVETLSIARAAGRRIYALEDVGDAAPWEVDLTGPTLFVVGGERHGIPAAVLAGADRVLRLPMHGFIPSYNLQAAMAGVAFERLRQLYS